MRTPPALPFVLLLLFSCPAHSQSTLPDLKSRLLHQPLYLRIRTRDDNLRYDSAGSLLGKVQPITFTLSGVDITSVLLKPDRLLLTGARVGLKFKNNVPERVELCVPNAFGDGSHPETMHFEIAAPASGDYTQALNTVFVASLAEVAPTLPSYWQTFAKTHLSAPTSPAPGASLAGAGTPPALGTAAAPEAVAHAGGNVTAPRLIKQISPAFSTQARALRYSAVVLVSIVIDTKGLPTKLAIVSPAGLELDERALAAVVHYIFQPAIKDGEPVPVEADIKVDFQVF